MLHWMHHLLFDPLSEWEKLKITLVVTPIALLVMLMIAASQPRGRH